MIKEIEVIYEDFMSNLDVLRWILGDILALMIGMNFGELV
jgi:hypothetical protein